MDTTFDATLENFNKRNEFLTKLWVWIIILSLYGLVIFAQEKIITCESKLESGNVLLPIINISVPLDYAVTFILLFLSGLIFKWLESFLRLTIFRRNIIASIIKDNPNILINKNQYVTRDFFDGLEFPGTTSVWGLIAKFQSINESFSKTERFFYYFLKSISFIAHFVIPFFVIIIGLVELKLKKDDLILNILSLLTGLLAIIILFLLVRAIVAEIAYILKVRKDRFLTT